MTQDTLDRPRTIHQEVSLLPRLLRQGPALTPWPPLLPSFSPWESLEPSRFTGPSSLKSPRPLLLTVSARMVRYWSHSAWRLLWASSASRSLEATSCGQMAGTASRQPYTAPPPLTTQIPRALPGPTHRRRLRGGQHGLQQLRAPLSELLQPLSVALQGNRQQAGTERLGQGPRGSGTACLPTWCAEAESSGSSTCRASLVCACTC